MTQFEHEMMMATYCIAQETRVLVLALAAKLGVNLTQIAKDMEEARPKEIKL